MLIIRRAKSLAAAALCAAGCLAFQFHTITATWAAETDQETQLKQVDELMHNGQWKEAIPIIQNIALAQKDDPASWATLGECYAQTSQYALAADAYGKALENTKNEHGKAVLIDLITAMYKEMGLLAVEGLVDSGGKQRQSSTSDYYEETIATGFGRWPKTKPVSICITAPGQIIGFKPVYVSILKDAFAEWTRATQGKLNFTYVALPTAADIVCYWNGSRKDIQNQAELGHSAIAYGGAEGIRKVDIVFVIDPPRPGDFLPENHFRKVALHEIGHAIGLFGHSPNRADIMYPVVEDTPKLASLSSRDVDTVQRLYTSAPPRPLAPPQKQATGTVATSTPNVAPTPLPATVCKQAYEATYACTSTKHDYTSTFTYDGKGNLMSESGEGLAKSQFMYFKSDGGNNYFIAHDRKIAMKVATKENDFDAYICEWNKNSPPADLTPLGTKVIDGHPCHGYSGKAGAINGEVWIADDLGVPVFTKSSNYGISTETKLTNFRKLANAPEIAIPAGYEITSTASYVEHYKPAIPDGD